MLRPISFFSVLSGSGTIRANGGETLGSLFGSGGGGRIGFNGVVTDIFVGVLEVKGGEDGGRGRAGTIYFSQQRRDNLTIGGIGNLPSVRLGSDDSNDYSFGVITINSGGLFEIDGNTNRNGSFGIQ